MKAAMYLGPCVTSVAFLQMQFNRQLHKMVR